MDESPNALAKSMPGKEEERKSDQLPQTVAQAPEDLLPDHPASLVTGLGQWRQRFFGTHVIPRVPSAVWPRSF